MTIANLKKLTKEHRAELALFVSTCLLDLSFGAEKLMEWRGAQPRPGTWALVFLTLGAWATWVGYKNLLQDIKSDCGEEK